ncbi:SRPBCC domain-containing protein [Flavihumibacter sp. R14]|nr:SRPBCC domain-containing protein [Flavihumibacter soli]
METEKHDWTKFTKRIGINAGISEIYKLISTPDGLESWFLRLAEFTLPGNGVRTGHSGIQKDDSYRWRWYGYSDETTETGKVLEANGADKIKFTFAGECQVTIHAYPHKEVTVVEITQENIPTDEKSKINYYLGCSEGWAFYLTNLKSLLEGGIDLRNRDETIQGVLNS